jgi:hypothetical protein
MTRRKPRRNRPEDFWNWVAKSDGCWEWTGALEYGYGVWAWQGRKWRAHRFSFWLAHGRLAEDAFVCHHCDNKKCVRPEHLYEGDAVTNGADAAARKRMAPQHGAHNPRAKLTDESVLWAREMFTTGQMTLREIANVLGVRSCGALHSAIYGRQWKHLPPLTGPITLKYNLRKGDA